MVGLPCSYSIRRLFAGFAVATVSASKAMEAFTKSRRMRRTVCGSPLRKSAAASSSAPREGWAALHALRHRLLEVMGARHVPLLRRFSARTGTSHVDGPPSPCLTCSAAA